MYITIYGKTCGYAIGFEVERTINNAGAWCIGLYQKNYSLSSRGYLLAEKKFLFKVSFNVWCIQMDYIKL